MAQEAIALVLGVYMGLSYHLRWLNLSGCDIPLTQYFILHKEKVFLLAAEQTGLDNADLLPSGMKETEG